MTHQKKQNKEIRKQKNFPKTVEEDLQLIDESELLKEDEKRLHPSIKKGILIFVSLLIVFLFLSLIYLQYPLFNVIQGRIESRSPNDNILQLKGFSITFTDNAMNSLKESFSINQDVETSRCLKGTINEKDYFITEVYTPKIYDQSFRHVTSEPCSDDTLIMFHTHPYKSCVASSTDLNTLKSNQEKNPNIIMVNPNIIMVIMCEPDRFSTYR